MDFCEMLEKSDFFAGMHGVNEDIIRAAEIQLGNSFSREYREYLLKYGVASIKGHEFFGLGASQRLDVVYNTLELRQENINIGDGFYVVEHLGIDGIVILQNTSGEVYDLKFDQKPQKICDSLASYIR